MLLLSFSNFAFTQKTNKQTPGIEFAHQLSALQKNAIIKADRHPEFAFFFPEMAGNLKFGLISGDKSIWLSQCKNIRVKNHEKSIEYTIADSFLGKGKISVTALSLSQTNGLIIRILGTDLPENMELFWSYGGGAAKNSDENVLGRLLPIYCKYNVFSVENRDFTMYYGQSMKLRIINVITPITSDIHLSDAHQQKDPLSFFTSGKTTDAPALAAKLPLKSNVNEFICVYKQNQHADYNHFMLPELFASESNLSNK